MNLRRDILGNEINCKCIGCAVGNGAILPPGGVIVKTKNFILHQDPEIPIKGFLIVTCKKHIKSISQLNPDEVRELFDLVYKARKAQMDIVDIKEVSIIQEERSGHFYLWLLPRYEWMDDKFENSLSKVREIMDYARANMRTDNNIKDILWAVEQIRKSIKNAFD